MASINKAILIGHLGRDPEVKYTQGGMAICNFSIATSERVKDGNGGYKEQTEWHKIICFSRTADACAKYLSKGSQVYIEGRIQTREWEKDGVKRYTTEIVANTVQFLSGGKGGGEERQGGDNQDRQREPGDDDIPF